MNRAVSSLSHLVGALNATPRRAHPDLVLDDEVRLATGRVHELVGDSADVMAALAAAHTTGPVVWIGRPDTVEALAPAGLQAFLDPDRVLLVAGVSRTELLWAAEQTLLACPGACVVVEVEAGPNLTESRRLQVAAENSGAVGFVIVHGRAQTSAAETRWVCEAHAEGGWMWTRVKNKRGEPGAWRVVWREDGDGPGLIHVAAAAAA